MDKINFLDGSDEEQTKALKEFLGLSSDQKFKDLDVDIYDIEDDSVK